ncbi:hypothetical protein [Pseudomonas sp. OF001]|uniref:hypothetical protein n=1 Tax=Pseudomonas sp. OF001 TaxID=2772300 RepID=UPI00191806B8|nr:hypothetical protein [Pseudomonas sp. OF001]
MRQLIRHLVAALKRHATLLKAIASTVTILGVTNYVPAPWWQSPLLSWGLSSQSTLTLFLIILFLFLWAYQHVVLLTKENEFLKEKNRIANLSPEEQADITKKKLTMFGRYLGRLLSSGEEKDNLKVISNGSNGHP